MRFVKSKDSRKWLAAMQNEMASHQENGTWILVLRPQHEKVLDNRWLFKIKRNPDGSAARYNARLVARGFRQEQGIDYEDTFALVCRYESIRILLTIAASKEYKIVHVDVKAAFLYGTLKETVFMEQPEGFIESEGLVCKLQKSLYGLKQAHRC